MTLIAEFDGQGRSFDAGGSADDGAAAGQSDAALLYKCFFLEKKVNEMVRLFGLTKCRGASVGTFLRALGTCGRAVTC